MNADPFFIVHKGWNFDDLSWAPILLKIKQLLTFTTASYWALKMWKKVQFKEASLFISTLFQFFRPPFINGKASGYHFSFLEKKKGFAQVFGHLVSFFVICIIFKKESPAVNRGHQGVIGGYREIPGDTGGTGGDN